MCLKYWLGLKEVTGEGIDKTEAELEMGMGAAEMRGRQAAKQRCG
jgi:hypothetical protein